MTGLPVVLGVTAIAAIASRLLTRPVLDLTENRMTYQRCRWCGAALRLHSVDEYLIGDDGRLRRRRAGTEPCASHMLRILTARVFADMD
jgi:hypothetical protein